MLCGERANCSDGERNIRNINQINKRLIMRIPTYQQFETQSRMLTEKYQYLTKLQKQIDSGAKIEHCSDDPILGDRIRSTQDYIKKIKSYEINEKTAHNKI